MTRGYTTNSQDGQNVIAPEKKRDTMIGGCAIRGGQVEAPPERKRWSDKKLRWGRTRGSTTTSRGRQEA